MAINLNISGSVLDPTLTRAANLACQGNPDGALRLLERSGIDQERIDAIKAIFSGLGPQNRTEAPQLKNHLLAILNGTPGAVIPQASEQSTSASLSERVQVISEIPQTSVTHLCFSEASISEFSNAYSCTFEFGNINYLNACVCFCSQQYTDQLALMLLILECNTLEEVLEFVKLNPMTEKRKAAWENPHDEDNSELGVMMHVLRAKFGQNPGLKEKLLATDDLFLVCQGNDPFWCDGFNGTGQNQLSICLMRLRKEYGGTGLVPVCKSYTHMIEVMNNRCALFVNEVAPETWIKHIFPLLNLASRLNYCFVNKFCYDRFWLIVKVVLRTIRPLHIIHLGLGKLPSFDNLELGKALIELSPEIEGHAGLTCLKVSEDFTISPNQLMEVAKAAGIDKAYIWPEVLQKLGNIPMRIRSGFYGNGIFKETEKKDCQAKEERISKDLGCEMVTVQELLVLCLYTRKNFQRSLFGIDPWSFGYALTRCEGNYLAVEAFEPGLLTLTHYCNNHDYITSGTIGLRRF